MPPIDIVATVVAGVTASSCGGSTSPRAANWSFGAVRSATVAPEQATKVSDGAPSRVCTRNAHEVDERWHPVELRPAVAGSGSDVPGRYVSGAAPSPEAYESPSATYDAGAASCAVAVVASTARRMAATAVTVMRIAATLPARGCNDAPLDVAAPRWSS